MKFNFKSRSFFNLLPFFIAVFVFGGCQSIPKKTSPEFRSDQFSSYIGGKGMLWKKF